MLEPKSPEVDRDDLYTRIFQLLSSGDSRDENLAYRMLLPDLVAYARLALGARRSRQVNLQADSVVASAIGRVLGGDLAFQNPEHLEGRMKIEVLRRIQTRGRRKADRHVQEPEDRPIGDAAAVGRSDRESLPDREDRLDVRRLLLDAVDGDDRELVDLALRGVKSEEIGRQLQISADTVRTRMGRMRRRLRAALLAPLRPAVSPEQWEIIDRLLIRKEVPTADENGMDAQDLVVELTRLIEELVVPKLGDEGADVLLMLLGRPKK